MAKKNSTVKKPLKPTKKAAPKRGKTVQPKVGALSAAASVLKAAKAPMTCGELIEAMAAKKLWVSPGGKTPSNTLHAAIAKEIATKGKDSRFAKADRGKFSLA